MMKGKNLGTPRRDETLCHPGIRINEYYLKPLRLSYQSSAALLGLEKETCLYLLTGHLRISPEIAWRLSRVFGGSVELWLNLQQEYDQLQLKKSLPDCSKNRHFRKSLQ